MKYRIVAKRVWEYGRRCQVRYFPQVSARRWYWFRSVWCDLGFRDNGYFNVEMAEEACKEHSQLGVRKEMML